MASLTRKINRRVSIENDEDTQLQDEEEARGVGLALGQVFLLGQIAVCAHMGIMADPVSVVVMRTTEEPHVPRERWRFS